MMIFKDRIQAAKLLAARLLKYRDTDTIVLAVPRGGVPVGYVIARELNLPLDIILSKKIGYPSNPEYAIGSVTLQNVILDNHPEVSEDYIHAKVEEIKKSLIEKHRILSGNRPVINLKGKSVILVDDGIATGNTLAACVQMLRNNNPPKIIVAVPVAPPDTAKKFRKLADEFVCLSEPEDFNGIGQFYGDFNQVDDEEVIRLMDAANRQKQP